MLHHYRLETDTRYYVISLYHDLCGDIVLQRRWGGKTNRRGGGKMEVFAASQRSALECKIRKILARRRYHCYRAL